MQCQYCGNRISLLRKLKDGEFCSDKHRAQYHLEQTRLALARLVDGENRFSQPARQEPASPPPPAIPDRPPEIPVPPEVAQLFPERPSSYPPPAPAWLWAGAQVWEAAPLPPAFLFRGLRTDWRPVGYWQPEIQPADADGGVSVARRTSLRTAGFSAASVSRSTAAIEGVLVVVEGLPPADSPPVAAARLAPIALPRLLGTGPQAPAMILSAAGATPREVEIKPRSGQSTAPRLTLADLMPSTLPPAAWAQSRSLAGVSSAGFHGVVAPEWTHILARNLQPVELELPCEVEPPGQPPLATYCLPELSAAAAPRSVENGDGALPAIPPFRLPRLTPSFAAGPSQPAMYMPAHPVWFRAGMTDYGGKLAIPLEAALPRYRPAEAQAPVRAPAARLLLACSLGLPDPALRHETRLLATRCEAKPPQPEQALEAQTTPLPAPNPRPGCGVRGPAVELSLCNAGVEAARPGLKVCAGLARLPLSSLLVENRTVEPAPRATPLPHIPTRRRPELRSRIELPNMASLVRCRGLSQESQMARLSLSEAPKGAAIGLAASRACAEAAAFPALAMPSPRTAMAGWRTNSARPSVPCMVRLFPVDMSLISPARLAAKPTGQAAQHTTNRPPRLPVGPAPLGGGTPHQATAGVLKSLLAELEGPRSRWAVVRVWRRSPVYAKGMALTLALLAVLVSLSAGPLDLPTSDLREGIRSRAAVDVVDDFRAGMGEWTGRDNWAETWFYDTAGLVETGKLALFHPSMSLNNYRFEFLAQIASKSIGWVFRAADTENYYAMKIMITKPGPLPTAAIVRYAVVNGKEGPRTQLPLPVPVRTDMMYRVKVNVDGSSFTTSVQDQVVDFWSDNRLTTGGVGLFSDSGEQARVRWVEVSHQSDFLGKLCAYLAPYDGHARNRSSTR